MNLEVETVRSRRSPIRIYNDSCDSELTRILLCVYKATVSTLGAFPVSDGNRQGRTWGIFIDMRVPGVLTNSNCVKIRSQQTQYAVRCLISAVSWYLRDETGVVSSNPGHNLYFFFFIPFCIIVCSTQQFWIKPRLGYSKVLLWFSDSKASIRSHDIMLNY